MNISLDQLRYALQSGSDGVQKHKTMSAVSVISTAACLLLICILFAVTMNIRYNMRLFQAENAMLAFVDDSVSRDAAEQLGAQLLRVPGVTGVTFITREEVFEQFSKEHSNDPALFKGASPTVFRDRYALSISATADLDDVVSAVKSIPGIADMKTDDTVVRGFAAVERTVSAFGLAITALLLIVCVIIMSNTIRLTIMARKQELAVMKMMGAYDEFIRLPFLCEGCIVGTIGAIVAFFATLVVYQGIKALLSPSGILALVSVLPTYKLAPWFLIISLVIGLVVGTASSYASTRTYLSRKGPAM